MSDIMIPESVWTAAITLAGAEYRLREWAIQCSDEDEYQVEHLRNLAYRSAEIIRAHDQILRNARREKDGSHQAS